jgi:hypothetical protein
MLKKDEYNKRTTFTLSLSQLECDLIDLFANKTKISRSKYIREAVFSRIEEDAPTFTDKNDPDCDKILVMMAWLLKQRHDEERECNRRYMIMEHSGPMKWLKKQVKRMKLEDLFHFQKLLEESIKEGEKEAAMDKEE